jgi:hypothetical protein
MELGREDGFLGVAYMMLHVESCHRRLRSKPLPLMLMFRYVMPGISEGSARAAFDWMRAGILRLPCLFFTWFACSVLRMSDGMKERGGRFTLFGGQ